MVRFNKVMRRTVETDDVLTGCPTGWLSPLEAPLYGQCYRPVHTTSTWFDARRVCRRYKNADLWAPQNPVEATILLNNTNISVAEIWVGKFQVKYFLIVLKFLL